ncbi:MAG: TetR family transcriptional regulator [Bradyrhizobium sp.]|nr:TetR family transcriptional regulator [Bradyrhizobium sp.]
MTPKRTGTAAEPIAGDPKRAAGDPKHAASGPKHVACDPKHAARATRTAGRRMRSLLLDAASRLFRERGLAGASISDIAAAADAFPSQITYYFRTKEALFVEAACRDMLYVARAAEQAALQAESPRDYTRALVEAVTKTDAVAFFAEALTLTRRRPDLAPLVERTVERLHAEGMRAYAGQIERHGWRSLRDPDASSRRFWAIAIGVMVEGYAMGRSPEELAAEMLRVLGDQATTKAAGQPFRIVGGATEETSEGESSS